MSVNQYAHPLQKKVLKHIIYVSDGRGMQFERIYRLTYSIVVLLAHFVVPGFQETLPNLGKCVWW